MDGEIRLPPVKERFRHETGTEARTAFHPAAAALQRSVACSAGRAFGIGRPSTYASIMQVLQDRDYVRPEKKRFIPEDRGRIVVTFLKTSSAITSNTTSPPTSRKSWTTFQAGASTGRK